MIELIEFQDIIPTLAAALVPALAAYVASTKGTRSAVAFGAAILLAALESLARGEWGLVTVEHALEAFVVQLTAYLAAWKPLGLNDRRPLSDPASSVLAA